VKTRRSLRTRVLFFTVLPIATLTLATLWMVNRRVTREVETGVRDDLRRSSAVVENVLNARLRALSLASDVIVRDPKFFSVLAIPGDPRDPELRSTVAGVAHDFNALTNADLFEVMNANGQLLASVGRESSEPASTRDLVRQAIEGHEVSGIMAGSGTLDQVLLTPVRAGGRVIGALLTGNRIDVGLAAELRRLTRSEVSFCAPRAALVSTLQAPRDRAELERAVTGLGDLIDAIPRQGVMFEVHAPHATYLTYLGQLPLSEPGREQVYVMQRSLQAETAFLREIQIGLIELGLLGLLVALLAGGLIAHRITSPVLQLVRGAEAMEQGNYEFPLDVKSRDEIGYLASRFGDMREKQRQVVTSLEDLARVRSEFISVASHELRTPISVIGGFQELMEAGALGPITDDQREALTAIRKNVKTLVKIAEDATRMGQIEHSDMQLSRGDCTVQTMLANAVSAAQADAPNRRVTVLVERREDAGIAWLDEVRMTLAVANLIRNGIRFTPDGGTVTVRAQRDDVQLEIQVADTGVGIEPEQQRHLFARSFMVTQSLHHHSSNTLEFNSAGLGMGLNIAAGIVTAHGGSVLVDSTPGRGSVFTILLPLETADVLETA
jgi:signal transduction histidine kinase